jgi:hypothetical protein
LVIAQNRFLAVARLGEHSFRLAIDECVQLGVQALDAFEVSASHLDRGHLPAPYLGCDFTGGKTKRA